MSTAEKLTTESRQPLVVIETSAKPKLSGPIRSGYDTVDVGFMFETFTTTARMNTERLRAYARGEHREDYAKFVDNLFLAQNMFVNAFFRPFLPSVPNKELVSEEKNFID